MRRGRPRTIKIRKRLRRRLFGVARRGAANPKQRSAQRARQRVRRKRGKAKT